MDEPTDLGQPEFSLLDQLPAAADEKFFWEEDQLFPVTEYDLALLVVEHRKMLFRKRLAPPVP